MADTLFDIKYYDSLDSTSLEARRIIDSSAPQSPMLIIAGEQSAGRGRCGRSFYSPAQTGLYMTLLVPLDIPITSQVTMTTRVAVAVSKGIDSFCNVKTGIKWVNDIYLDSRKICGILCEAVNDYEKGILRYALIGVGVNLTTRNFPTELQDRAGSVMTADSELCGMISMEKRTLLATELSELILEYIKEGTESDFLAQYRERSIILGRDIIFTEDGIKIAAKAVDIDSLGGLVVEYTDPQSSEVIRRTLSSGEISVRTYTS